MSRTGVLLIIAVLHLTSSLDLKNPLLMASSSSLSSLSAFDISAVSDQINQSPFVQIYSLRSSLKPRILSKVVQKIFQNQKYPALQKVFGNEEKSFFSMYLEFSQLKQTTNGKSVNLDLNSADFDNKHSSVMKSDKAIESIDCYLADLKKVDDQIQKDMESFTKSNKPYLIILTFDNNDYRQANDSTVQFNSQSQKGDKKQLKLMMQVPKDMESLFTLNWGRNSRFSSLRSLSENNDKKAIGIDGTTLSGYLISIFLLVILLIGTCCLFGLQTPASFTKSNFVVGKEA